MNLQMVLMYAGVCAIAVALATSIALVVVAKSPSAPAHPAALSSLTATKNDDVDREPFGVTFVIPTMNRPTLPRTLESLKAQTNPNWSAIVVFDGVIPEQTKPDDPRIKYVFLNKRIGRQNGGSDRLHGQASAVRNYGIQARKTLSWLAFVDDDDTVSPHYVEALQHTIATMPDTDVVIFRMQYKDGKVLPPPGDVTFRKNYVGISFSYRRRLFDDGFAFGANSSAEDYNLLDRFREAGRQIFMHPGIMYYVEPARD